MSETFSHILSGFSGFDCAFWASYSVQFSAIDFLIKKDLSKVMNPCSVHVICDGQQYHSEIEKAVKSIRGNDTIEKIQEYCTFSTMWPEGAFHPKILLLANQESILSIVSSANLTSSGVLSNQDMVASYYYSEGSKEHEEMLSGIYQYLNSFDGWIGKAKEDLENLGQQFKFLSTEYQNQSFFSIPQNNSLFEQIKGSVSKGELKSIKIFSPFYDDELKAVSVFKEEYSVPVECFVPDSKIIVTSEKKLSESVSFYGEDALSKPTFHAKMYAFDYGEYLDVFWGSANCTYSGLLSSNRNYEYLVRTKLYPEEMYSLWGIQEAKELIPRYCAKDEKKTNENTHPCYELKSSQVQGDKIFIDVSIELNSDLNSTHQRNFTFL